MLTPGLKCQPLSSKVVSPHTETIFLFLNLTQKTSHPHSQTSYFPVTTFPCHGHGMSLCRRQKCVTTQPLQHLWPRKGAKAAWRWGCLHRVWDSALSWGADGLSMLPAPQEGCAGPLEERLSTTRHHMTLWEDIKACIQEESSVHLCISLPWEVLCFFL